MLTKLNQLIPIDLLQKFNIYKGLPAAEAYLRTSPLKFDFDLSRFPHLLINSVLV